MWDSVAYFENCQKKLKLTKNYEFCRVSGINNLEDVLSRTKGKKDFFAVNDTDDGVTVRVGGAYFQRRVITVFLLKKYNISDMQERETKLAETRTIKNKLTAKIIADSGEIEEMFFIDKTRFPYKEVPGFFANGTCGIYFFVTIQEPVNLVIDDNDWE